jgi:hypothetical protein
MRPGGSKPSSDLRRSASGWLEFSRPVLFRAHLCVRTTHRWPPKSPGGAKESWTAHNIRNGLVPRVSSGLVRILGIQARANKLMATVGNLSNPVVHGRQPPIPSPLDESPALRPQSRNLHGGLQPNSAKAGDVVRVKITQSGARAAVEATLCTSPSRAMLRLNCPWALKVISLGLRLRILLLASSPRSVGCPPTRYSDVLGQNTAVEAARDLIELPLKHADLFLRIGAKPAGHGIILAGPLGTGKNSARPRRRRRVRRSHRDRQRPCLPVQVGRRDRGRNP